MRKEVTLIISMIVMCIALIGLAGTAKASPAVISVQPSHIDVSSTGQTFKVNITITDSPAIVQWMIRVQYNPAVLTHLLANETTSEPLVDAGDFLSNAGGSSPLFAKPLMTPGNLSEISAALFADPGVAASGSGWLCTLNFNATAMGDSDITIYDSDLRDEYELPHEHTRQDGTVTVIPEFPMSLILPLFLVTTAVIVGVSKVAWTKRHRGHINAS